MPATADVSSLEAALTFAASWWAWGCLHECAHLAVARALGARVQILEIWAAFGLQRCVVLEGLTTARAAAVRHAGWVVSLWAAAVAVAVASTHADDTAPRFNSKIPIAAAAVLVACEALASDLFGWEASFRAPPGQAKSSTAASLSSVPAAPTRFAFHCGNFGLVLLGKDNSEHVLGILKKMVQVCAPSSM